MFHLIQKFFHIIFFVIFETKFGIFHTYLYLCNGNYHFNELQYEKSKDTLNIAFLWHFS